MPAPTRVRVDAWLWAVRVYKTRSEATTACRAGHVRLNGAPVKAAQTVVPGDRLRIRRSGEERDLEVSGLINKRVSAQVARTVFIDHTPPREKVVVPQVPIRDRGAGRPTKKDRREMDALRASWIDED